MPVVELSYSRLRRLVGGSSKKQIADLLPFLGLDVESEDGDLVRVEYSPNRPDYSTDFGIALGMQGLLGIKTGAVRLRVRRSERFHISVKPGVSRIRPFVTGVAAKNGRIDDKTIRQLMAMQEDLHFGLGRRRERSSIGIHDLDKMTFPLTYSTTGRDHRFVPLNSEKELSISQILESTGIGEKYGHILADSPKMPVITDSKNEIISFPPIINAAVTAMTVKTKNLFVEVTGIDRGDAENMLSVVAVILQSAGFTLEQVKISGSKNSTPKLGSREMRLDPALVNQVLGLNLSSSKIISCLKKSRLDASPKGGGSILCVIPPHRFDLFGPMDLVEEAALGYGIQNLKPVLSPSQAIGQASPVSRNLRYLSQVMVGLGYLEVLNSSLTSKRVLYNMTNRGEASKTISVREPKSQEHAILRDSILPGLLENLSRNIHEPYPQKIFETGSVFLEGSSIKEGINLSGVSAHQDANFTETKSVLQSGLKIGFGLKVQTRATTHPAFEGGRCASVLADGRSIGVVGEISSRTVEGYKIRVPVAGFEISLSDSILKPA